MTRRAQEMRWDVAREGARPPRPGTPARAADGQPQRARRGWAWRAAGALLAWSVGLGGAACLAGGCGEAPIGRYTLAFTWADGRPADLSGLSVRLRVEVREDPAKPGRVLSDAGPAPFEADGGLSMVLPELTPGPNRVIVAELRTGPLPNDPVAYYGRSAPFSVEPGVSRTVPVAVQLRAVPASGGEPGLAVLVKGEPATGDAALVSGAQVTLRLTTDTGVRARLSPAPTFPQDQTTLVDLDEPPVGEDGLRRLDVPWDLDAGAEPCASNYCPRRVYARFTDDEGYESLVVEARAVIDVVPPSLLRPEGVTITPTQANAASSVVVSLTFDEPLGAPPTLRLKPSAAPGPAAPSFTFEQTFPSPDAPLGTTYTLRATSPAGVLSAGEHELELQAEDRAGNPAGQGSAWLAVGSFSVDPAPPALTVESPVTPPQAPPGYVNAATQAAAAAAPPDSPLRVSVVVRASEPLAGPPDVRLGGLEMPCEEVESPGGSAQLPTFTCAHALTGYEPDGSYTVTVSTADLAGNAAAASYDEPIVFDTVPPVPVQVVVEPKVLAPGREALIQVGMSEPMALGVAVSAAPPLDDSGALAPIAQSPAGGTWLVTAPAEGAGGSLPAGWVDGEVPLHVTGTDPAGNPVPAADAQVGSITLDGTPPELLSLGLTGEPFTVGGSDLWGFNAASAQPPEDVITARFFASEPLQPSSVRGSLGPYPAACVPVDVPTSLPDGAPPPPGGQAWACSFQPSGTEPDAVRVFVLEAADTAGNPAELELTGAPVLFDKTAPTILPGTEALTLAPAATNPLSGGGFSAAREDTSVSLRFGVSEPLSSPPVVRAVPTDPGGAASLDLPCVVQAAQTAFVCELPAGSLPVGLDAHFRFEIALTDSLHNTATVTLDPTVAELRVDTAPPPAPDVATDGRVTLTRAPWGTTATGYLPRLGVRGDAGALSPGAAVWVRALTMADPTQAAELGRAPVDGDGGFGRCPEAGCNTLADEDFGTLILSAADLQRVWVQAIDEAGNTSAPVLIRDVTWVASLGGKVAGSTAVNPHRLDAYAEAPPTPLSTPDRELALAPPTGELTKNTTTHGRGRWEHLRSAPSITPPPRAHAPVGYDPYRDRLVLFSGGPTLDDTWEYGDGRWTLRCDPALQPCEAPGPDDAPDGAPKDTALAYDAQRSELLYVTPFAKALWSWDGARWTQRCGPNTTCSMPLPGTAYNALAYDPVRRRVVALFSDSFGSVVRAWTGASWEPLCATGDPSCGLPSLPFKSYPKLTYDLVRGRLVLFFTSQAGARTWELPSEGEAPAWALVCDGAPGGGSCPSPNDGAGIPAEARSMVFDEAVGEVVLVTRAYGATWTYSGGGWVERVGTFPGGDGTRPALFFDRARGVVRAYLPSESTLWDWTGSSWRLACGPGGGCASPGPRWGAAAASDDQASVVLFGGRREGGDKAPLGDTWVFDGRTWRPGPDGWPAPPAGPGGAMAFLPSSRAYLLIPADAPRWVSPNKTRLWLSETLLSGAPRGWTELCDPWDSDPVAVALCGAPAPAPRAFATLRWDSARKAAVLLGGLLSGGSGVDSLGCLGVSCEAWAWRAGRWQLAGDTGNPGTHQHASVWSPEAPSGLWSYGGIESAGGIPTRSARLTRVSIPPKGTANPSVPCGGGDDGDTPCTPGARTGAHLSYDPGRHALLLFGGYDGDPNDALASPVVWEYRPGSASTDAGTWTQVACPIEEGCETPPGRAMGTLEYLPVLGRHALFGGTIEQALWSSDTPDEDTWLYDAGARGRPAHVLTVAYAASGGPLGEQCTTPGAPCPLRGLRVRWAGEALGAASDGTPTAGPRLEGWAEGRWKVLAVGADGAGGSTGQRLEWATNDPALVGSLMVPGRPGTLHLAVEPRGTNGDLPGFAELRTDALEVAVRYHLDAEGGVCGDGAVDLEAGEACDLGVDGNDGSYGGCTASCQRAPRCGDGVVDEGAGEECDAGELGGVGACDASCHWKAQTCTGSDVFPNGPGVQTLLVAGDTTGAPDQITGSCLEHPTRTPSPGLAYELVVPTDGTLSARLDGVGALDAALSVRGSCAEAASERACVTADAAPGDGPWLQVPVAGGEALTLVVEGRPGSEGPFELALTFRPAPSADACADAAPLTLTATEPLTVTGSTADATDALAAPCADTGSPERLFSFVAPGNGEVRARVVRAPGSTLDPVVWITRASCGYGLVMPSWTGGHGCDDDRHGRDAEAWWTVTAGTTYKVGVEGFGGSAGAFTLVLAFVPDTGPQPACTSPTPLTVGALSTASVSGSTISAFDESAEPFPGGCDAVTRWSRVYEVTPGASGTLRARVDGHDGFDPMLAVMQGACGNPNEATCQDDASPTDRGATVDAPATAGVPVYFQIQGYGGQVGDFTLTVTHSAP